MTSPAAVTLLWGEDPYLLRERALELVGDRRPTEVDANEWRGIELQDLATPSLFGEPRALIVTGAGALTAPTHLDFQIVVPKILYLRVGAGTNMATNSAVNMLTFTVPPASVGNGTAIASTGGDLLSGAAVTARVIANSGTVTVTTTAGSLATHSTGQISTGKVMPRRRIRFSQAWIAAGSKHRLLTMYDACRRLSHMDWIVTSSAIDGCCSG